MNTEMLRNKVYESLEWLVKEDSLDQEQVRSEINECSVISDFREIYRKYGYTPNEGTEMILKILSC